MKTKKYLKLYDRDGFLVVIERIKNDKWGNPRYNLIVFEKDTLYFRGNWKVVTYDVDHYIEVLLANIKEVNMKTKRRIEIISRNGFLVTIERTKNDKWGNPKYNISVFEKDTLYFVGNWDIVTYDVDHYIDVMLSNIKGEEWKQ